MLRKRWSIKVSLESYIKNTKFQFHPIELLFADNFKEIQFFIAGQFRMEVGY